MNDHLCTIDIGSTLCRVLVARPDSSGMAEVIGVGTAPMQGVRAGVIVNIESSIQAISKAAREAELMSGLVVEEALVNITGKHLRGDNSRGVVAISNRDRIVSEADVMRVIEGAQNIRIPADQEVIHVLAREFMVDDQDGIRDPVGMTGVRLEADVHIVTAALTALSNLNKSVNGAGIQITDGVMSSLASAEAVLSEGEKDLGTAVIDFGGGVCDIVVYLEGGVCFSSVIPLGGLHITQDLSIGLKIPVETAEMIKKSQGAAKVDLMDPTEKIELPGMPGRPPRWVLRQDVAAIIEPRVKEIFELIDAELIRAGRKSSLAGGIVLTGGTSLLDGALSLAEEVFDLPVSLGLPTGMSGFTDRVQGPEYSTGIGLIHYAGRLRGDSKVKPVQHGRPGIMDRLKKWLSENL